MNVKYWTTELNEDHRLYLLPASPTVVVCFLWEPRQGVKSSAWNSFKMGLVCMGPTEGDGYKDVEDVSKCFLGFYGGHIELAIEQYASLDLDKAAWIWATEETLNALIPIMRSQWVSNMALPDHVNSFYSYLGFNEFHASRHAYLQEHGRMPPLIEGKKESRLSDVKPA